MIFITETKAFIYWLIDWCLMPTLTVFQLNCGIEGILKQIYCICYSYLLTNDPIYDNS